MRLQIVILLFLFFVSSDFVDAQQLRENEVVVIRGEKYVLHQVRTGETIFSITKKFNVNRETLIENNPDIASGLKIGDIIKIPYRENADLSEKPIFQKGDPSGFKMHTIKSRTETPYFIAKEYGVTVEEIYTYNPQIRRYKRGTKVRIPLWDAPAGDVTQKIEPIEPQIDEKLRADERNQKDELIKHRVRPGETLYSIAKRYNISESEILFFNPDAKKLRAGDIIYLPKEEEPELQPDELTEEIGAGNYFEHIIESGETMWGITRKYDVSEEELKSLNPVLRSGFPAGVVIKIPVREEETVKAKPVNKDAFFEHRVKRNETLYGIASEYDLTIPEIEKYNPFLEKRNLVTGETLLIPRKPDEQIVDFMQEKADVDSVPVVEPDYFEIEIPVEIPESCKPSGNQFYSSAVYDIALFLPLYLEANDTLNKKPKELELLQDSLAALEEDPLDDAFLIENDTIIEEDEPEDMFFGFYRNSENFVEFYEGVLLAVDSMQQAGMNINLTVFDTQHNIDSVREAIYSSDFLETDLIIGPVYPDLQEEISGISAKNRIPMVSPLAANSDVIRSNNYYYQVTPNREYIAEETAELIADEYFNSNFIIFKTSEFGGTPEGRLVEMIREKLYNSGFWGKPNGVTFSVYDFEHEGPFGFRRILSKTKKNVVYIPTSVVGELSVAISNINNLADEYPITLIGSNRFQHYESIELEHFHNLNLEYVAPYWVDYQEKATVDFFEKFRNNFYTDPSNFGVQGYDVAFYFLNALNTYGKDFSDCLPYLQLDLVQGNYRFEKVSPFGGFMNEGLSVISYERDFDVVEERVIGGQFKIAQK